MEMEMNTQVQQIQQTPQVQPTQAPEPRERERTPAPAEPAAPSTREVIAQIQSENTSMLLQRMFGDQAGINARAVSEPLQQLQENVEAARMQNRPPSISEILSGMENITQEQAQEYISEGGFWGVERTSQRLFDTAMRISSGDAEIMAEMRDAINRGFEAAQRQWSRDMGEDLPQISRDTLAATMDLFDTWQRDNPVGN